MSFMSVVFYTADSQTCTFLLVIGLLKWT